MPVDTTVPGSPGWWMLRLYKKLQAEQDRLQMLDNYRRGRPPIVLGSARLQSAFYRFQNMSRSNFAALIVSAMTERMAVRSIRTAAANDDNGDLAAWKMWTANNLDVFSTDVHTAMGTFGCTYVAVGAPQADGEQPVITAEDPRQTITLQDPLNPTRTVAGFKIFHDDARDMDYVYLWLPGQMWVAQRPRKAQAPSATSQGARWGLLDGPPPPIPVAFAPRSFDLLPMGQRIDGQLSLDDEQSEQVLAELPDDYDGPTSETFTSKVVPVVRFGNRDGVGEFELHTDLLDRINHTVLNKIVIATYQAFKQRAIEVNPTGGADDDGGLPDEDENGNPIDYNDVFAADPGALWRLPLGAKIWESGQVDMNGILSSAKDDILHLAAVSRTPFPMFSPDSANQSANGASLYREGLTFKVEDRCKIAGNGWGQVIAIGFQFLGDEQRGEIGSVIVDWAPADRYSILEMAQADAQSTLPLAQKAARIYGMSPDEVKITLAQAAQERMLQAALAPKPAAPLPPGTEQDDAAAGQ